VSKVAEIRASLAQRLGVEVQLIDPWRQISYNKKDFDPGYLQAVGPLFTVAVGLAMRRVGDK
jgi:type IV pilus assembly protein PilM